MNLTLLIFLFIIQIISSHLCAFRLNNQTAYTIKLVADDVNKTALVVAPGVTALSEKIEVMSRFLGYVVFEGLESEYGKLTKKPGKMADIFLGEIPSTENDFVIKPGATEFEFVLIAREQELCSCFCFFQDNFVIWEANKTLQNAIQMMKAP